MITPQPIGLFNTGAPALLLAVAAAVMPRLIAGRASRSQRRLAAAVAISATVLWLGGAAMFAALYAIQGIAVASSLAEAPIAVAWFFMVLSAKAALLWGPVLALVWFVSAQGVERRVGEDRARENRP